jgi:hypothetical protein
MMMIGKNLAVALATAAFGLVLLCQPGTATADDVTVKKNGTPLMLSPMRDAPTEWKVNSGFPLSVVEKRGDWVRVQSAQLPKEGGELWVPANQVVALGGSPIASSAPAGPAEEPIGYRVELTGTPGMKFKLECRIVKDDGNVGFRPHYNRLPMTYEYPGNPLACAAWKKQHNGELQIKLVEVYPSRERILGRASTKADPASLFARSRGPDSPTSIFSRLSSPWETAAVVSATHDDLVLPPPPPAGP